MLRIITDGEDDHRIENADGTVVGWIRGRSVGFWGFADEARAVDAATVAWRSLDGSLRRQFPGWARHDGAYERVRVVDDDARTWIVDDERRLARLIRRADDRATPTSGDGPFGIELELPSYASTGVVIAAAHLMGAVIQRLAGADPAGDAPSAVAAA